MAYEQIWTAFNQEFPQYANAAREAWQFGVDPDLLAQLVVSGEKTATSSYFAHYLHDREAAPGVGEINLILDAQNQPKVITINTKVVLQPYAKVDEEIGCLEGEGTRDLAYWRAVHEPFFTEVAQSIGKTFSPDDLIVTEFFEVLKVLS